MSYMKRLFEDLLEIQRISRNQPPEAVDFPDIVRRGLGERKEFWPEPDEERFSRDEIAV